MIKSVSARIKDDVLYWVRSAHDAAMEIAPEVPPEQVDGWGNVMTALYQVAVLAQMQYILQRRYEWDAAHPAPTEDETCQHGHPTDGLCPQCASSADHVE